MTLKIAQVFLEEVHFGHNGDFLAKEPTAFAAPHEVQMEVGLIKGSGAGNVAVRLLAKSDNSTNQYSFRASYLILFQLEGENAPDLERRIGVTGATMLMPFLREIIGNISQRARFGACWLAPANFNEIMSTPAEKAPSRSQATKTRRKPPKRKS